MGSFGGGVRTARKEHVCWGCEAKIAPGQQCHYHTSTDMGKLSTAYWCEDCSAYLAEYHEEGDLYTLGEVGRYREEEARNPTQEQP